MLTAITKHKLWSITILLLLIINLYLGLFISKLQANKTSLTIDERQLLIKITNLKIETAKLTALQLKLQQLQMRYVFHNTQAFQAVEQLAEITRQAKVQFLTFEPEKTGEYTLTIAGDYFTITDFLKKLFATSSTSSLRIISAEWNRSPENMGKLIFKTTLQNHGSGSCIEPGFIGPPQLFRDPFASNNKHWPLGLNAWPAKRLTTLGYLADNNKKITVIKDPNDDIYVETQN